MRKFTKKPVLSASSTARKSIVSKVTNSIYNAIEDEFLDNIAVKVASEVPEYDPSWIAEGFSQNYTALENAQMKFATELAKYLTENCTE